MPSLKVIRLENSCNFDELEACESLAKAVDIHSRENFVFSIFDNTGCRDVEIREGIESEQNPLGSIEIFDRENQCTALVYPRKVGVSLEFKCMG